MEVYRQCADQQCPAFRLDLPHSHLEESSFDQLEIFKARWMERKERPTTLLDTTDIHERLESLHDVSETFTGTFDAGLNDVTQSWLSIPIDPPEWTMQKIGEYITWVETGLTADVCKCERIPHPTKPGVFGGETSLECPAHAKEGLVLGFFKWLETHGG